MQSSISNASPRDIAGPRRRTIAVVIGVTVGLVWSTVQFLGSEILYRASESSFFHEAGSEFLMSTSDFISWPAGSIYTSIENRRVQAAVDEALSGKIVSAESRKKITELTDQGARDPDHEGYIDLIFLLDEVGIDSSVPVSQEYLIYGSTCAAWGLIFGLVAGLLAWNIGGRIGGSRHTCGGRAT